MNKITKGIATLAAAVALAAGLSGCYTSEYRQREQQQAEKQSATKTSLEKSNLQRKLKLDEDPNRIGYVYLMSFGKPIGYYTIKGKVSSNGSQLTPEQDIVRPYSGTYIPVDGPQDDGTYGEGDPGVFFFTTENVMVVTSLDYFYATQPVPSAIDIPKLG